MYDSTGLGTDNSLSLRRSWASNPNKVITPQKIGGVYLYDVPPGTKLTEKTPIPRYSPSGSYDIPLSSKPILNEAYDEPRPHNVRPPPIPTVYDSPKTNVPVSANEPVVANDPISDQISTYDVPKPSDKDLQPSHIITISDNYDVPPSLCKNSPSLYDGRAFSRSSNSTSGSSSFRSPSGSHSSIETLSLSSVGGGSNRSSLEQHPNDVYDIPPEPQPVLRLPHQSSLSQETYDVPSNNMPAQIIDPKQMKTPVVLDGVYDIPPQAMRDTCPVPKTDVVDSCCQITVAANKPSEEKEFVSIVPECAEMLLDRESAVELLMKHHQEVQSSISKLFSFVSTTWRKYENMNNKLPEIQVTCHKLQSSIVDLFNFFQGALANSAHAADKSLCFKLNKLVSPIKESCTTIKTCVQALDDKGWIASNLSYSEESYTPDELDMLVSCARNLVEDVRQVTSLIQGNSTLLFKSEQSTCEKSKPPVAPKPNIKAKPPISAKPGTKLQQRPLPPTPQNNALKSQLSGEYFNEYDYVNLESKETVEKENESIKATLSKEMSQNFDELVKQSEVLVVSHTEVVLDKVSPLDPKDVQLLSFYSVQLETHITHLTKAIDAFLMTIKNNQPPKVFVGHSKFIIIGAHKLVYIGDTVHRNLSNSELKTQVMQNSNSLCDSLKTLVVSTKKAAADFPSVVAVQEMVDSVVDVSHLANNLKLSIVQAS
ncbi:breast cancer anti-estrogen resistance protein 1 isoform X2 [Parasteatoda tepidariorum]